MRARCGAESRFILGMTFDDGEETDARSKTKEHTARKIRLSDLLRGPFDIKSVALTGLFVLALFYTMYFMRAILLPLVLALLLSYLLRPIVRGFARIHIRPPFGAAIVLIGLVALIGYAISLLAAPAAGWLEKAPYSLQSLQAKLVPLRQPMQNVARASGEIEKLTTPEAPQTKPAVEVKRHPIADALYVRGPEFVVRVALLLILLYF